MSYGFWKLGFRLAGAVDAEIGKPGLGKSAGTSPPCNATYERNFGLKPLKEDIGRLDTGRYRRSVGLRKRELTVLISCAPCTGFSQKKAKNHLSDDPRNWLVEKSGEFVAEFLPEFFIMENVKELLRGRFRSHFNNLKSKLVDLGYTVRADICDFAELGVPQRRIRAIIIARRDGGPIPPLSKTSRMRTVRDAISHLPLLNAGEQHPDDPMHVCPKHTPMVIERMRAIPKDGGSWSNIPPGKRHLLIRSMVRPGRRKGSFPDVYGRLWWDRPAPTITRECGHPGNGRYTHPELDRMLSVREMALVQGFPPDFYFVGPLVSKYNQVGDAVPPTVSEAIARLILDMRAGRVSVPVQERLSLAFS
jgi:DNA (cytosine-5)-methyltransferase 1